MSMSLFLASIPVASYQKIIANEAQIDEIIAQECTKCVSFEHDAQHDLDGFAEFGITFDSYIEREIGEYQFYHVYQVDELIKRFQDFLNIEEDELLEYWSDEQFDWVRQLVQDRILSVLKHTSRLDQYLVSYWG